MLATVTEVHFYRQYPTPFNLDDTQRGMKEWADKTDIKDINCLLLV